MTLGRHPSLEAHVELFRNQASRIKEEWKADHEEAMRILDLESTVSLGVSLCREIHFIDETLRRRERKEGKSYDEIHDLIGSMYQIWLEAARLLLLLIRVREKQGWDVSGSKDLESCVQEVSCILTPDDKFFSGPTLDRLIEQAKQDVREGRVEDME